MLTVPLSFFSAAYVSPSPQFFPFNNDLDAESSNLSPRGACSLLYQLSFPSPQKHTRVLVRRLLLGLFFLSFYYKPRRRNMATIGPYHTTLPHITKDNWRDLAAQKREKQAQLIPVE